MRLHETKDPFEFLTEDDQARKQIGNLAQRAVIQDFKQRIPNSRCVAVAPKSSKKTDIMMRLYNGLNIQIECKHVSNFVTVFDSTISRGSRDEVLDWFASRVAENPNKLTMAQLVDAYRKTDKRYGFQGDKGTAEKTGLVPALWIRSPTVCEKLKMLLMKKYMQRNENYLALVRPNGITYHYIDGPKIPELDNLPFPKILKAKTDTYGEAKTPGTLRVAIKAIFGL